MIPGTGWEVWQRDIIDGADGYWLPVAFFVPAGNQQGLAIVVLVLQDGRLVASNGKLRRAGD